MFDCRETAGKGWEFTEKMRENFAIFWEKFGFCFYVSLFEFFVWLLRQCDKIDVWSFCISCIGEGNEAEDDKVSRYHW